MQRIVYGDNLAVLADIADASVPLIYIDPPFNTGTTQVRERLTTTRDEDGDRTGFLGQRYRTERQALSPSTIPSTTTSVFWSRACVKLTGYSRRMARSTSISIIARCTTSRCCSTGSSGVNAS